MLKIDSLDHKGRGIARENNKIVFVENALPYEIVEIKVLKDKKKYKEADVFRYIKKSNKRIKPLCPYYNFCGGCNIMHIDYTEQLNFKQEKVLNIFQKYLKGVKVSKIIKSDKNINYRDKVTFQINNNFGFYSKNSHDVVDIDNCIISDELINKSIKYIKQINLSEVNKVVCRVGLNELMIIIYTNNRDLNIDPLKYIASSIYLNIDNEYINVYGSKYIYEKLDRYKFAISPDSFFQVNRNTCLKLYKKIKKYVGINKNILDLYCGTGSIGIFVSENNHVTGIEINKFAVDDANKNKEINNLNNINFICGSSKSTLKNIKIKPDVVIIDPPRSGLDKDEINNIIKLNPKQIIYVSCDPMTMARDLNIFKTKYDIEEITPFDMFPNTYHVECLAVLKH